jgi:CO/xanthine dehydrogenase Mo-binding subunit
MAMLKAARAMKRTLQSVAEQILGHTDLLFGDEKVYSLSHPEKVISFKALAKAAHLRGAPMVETAWHDITTKDVDPETAQGDAYAAYAYATQIAEVEVDTETGQVEVLRIVTATDAGKAINPLNVEGQIEGGVSMGVGYALSEEIIQEGGYLKTPALGDYMVPTSLDMPPIETHIVEVPISTGPYGAKGVGEPASIPTAPAILNAISAALNIRVTELPATPENILRLIREKERG